MEAGILRSQEPMEEFFAETNSEKRNPEAAKTLLASE